MVTPPKTPRPDSDDYTARLQAIRHLLATQDGAEDVVLASEDPSVTPARLVIGTHGPTVDMGDGVRLSLAGVGEEQGLQADSLVSAQRRGMLGLIRRPELALRSLYRHSALRRLIRRLFPRLREMEDNIIIAAMLEEAYGAPSGLRHRLERFVRRNVLLVVSIGALAVVGGQTATPLLLDSAAMPHLQWTETTLTLPPAPVAEVEIEQEPATAPIDPARVLAHCSVTPHARTRYSAADDATRRDLLRELVRFQERLRGANIDHAWHSARLRHAAIASVTMPALDEVTAGLEAYRTQRSQTLEELAAVEQAYRTSRDPSQMRHIDGVNRSIRLRDELTRLETGVRNAPGENAVAAVEAAVVRLRERLALDVAQGDAGATVELPAGYERALVEIADRDLRIPVSGLTSASPTLAAVHLRDLHEALVGLERVIYEAYAELRVALDRVALEEESANRRFASLADDDARPWIGTAGCLEQMQVALRQP